MQALILAGGEATRLRPLTSTIPKPVVPLGDRPFIAHMIEWLRRHGVDDVILACGFMAGDVRAVLGDGAALGVRLRYVEEPRPLGTGGALKYAEDVLDDRFLMLNGDVLTDIDYGSLLQRHRESDAAATIATKLRHVEVSLGVLRFGDNGDPTRLTGYDEKPAIDFTASMGVYCFAPRALSFIEPGEHLDFPDLILRLIAAGEVVRAWRSEDYWLDIGRHDDYERAQEEFESVRDRLIPPDPPA